MVKSSTPTQVLRRPLVLPCGAVLKHRLAKAAMSDSLADGRGDPTAAQLRLYERWAQGGIALSIIGEVHGDPCFPERPGNLVLGESSNQQALQSLAGRASIDDAHLWPQLGHAGALSHAPISQPKGPSALDIGNVHCRGMSTDEVRELPDLFAKTAACAMAAGFSGVQIHAAHSFLLSQFLSPLFNRRTDSYGGTIEARCRVVIDVVDKVRSAVGPTFPIGIKINATDKLGGGLTQDDALEVVRFLDGTSVDLIDISGGSYFPGAKATSDGSGKGPYFVDFARRARAKTSKPLMLTGGFKTREQAANAVASGAIDVVGLARAMVLDPRLPKTWLTDGGRDPDFPRFESAPPGGITAWYTMRLTALAEGREDVFTLDLASAIRALEDRDALRCETWRQKFGRNAPGR
jgi:2,4-dienoyl-CoA reductase-like NADH-dependent reductase (Old Yellow Enzyme family)